MNRRNTLAVCQGGGLLCRSGNAATILIGLVLILIVYAIIKRMIKNKKQGGSACGCNCGSCNGGCCARRP